MHLALEEGWLRAGQRYWACFALRQVASRLSADSMRRLLASDAQQSSRIEDGAILLVGYVHLRKCHCHVHQVMSVTNGASPVGSPVNRFHTSSGWFADGHIPWHKLVNLHSLLVSACTACMTTHSWRRQLHLILACLAHSEQYGSLVCALHAACSLLEPGGCM